MQWCKASWEGFILRGDLEGLLGLRGNEGPRVVPELNFDSSGGEGVATRGCRKVVKRTPIFVYPFFTHWYWEVLVLEGTCILRYLDVLARW